VLSGKAAASTASVEPRVGTSTPFGKPFVPCGHREVRDLPEEKKRVPDDNNIGLL
jgi:hypothetical protein